MFGRRIVTFLLLFILLASAGWAAEKAHKPAKLVNDTSHIVTGSFNGKAIDKYRSDPDFDYSGNGVAMRPTLWARFWNWFWRKIAGGISGVKNGWEIIEYSILGVAIGFLVYFILKATGIDMTRLWSRGGEKVGLDFTESLENIHEINFDSEIEKAVAQHNFRLAVRLLYLKCLKQLSDTKLIDWQIDKTNTAYLTELSAAPQRQAFGILTLQFEYVWYGNFPIDQQAYGNISTLFQDFKKQLP